MLSVGCPFLRFVRSVVRSFVLSGQLSVPLFCRSVVRPSCRSVHLFCRVVVCSFMLSVGCLFLRFVGRLSVRFVGQVIRFVGRLFVRSFCPLLDRSVCRRLASSSVGLGTIPSKALSRLNKL